MPSAPPRRSGFLACLGAEAGFGFTAYTLYDLVERSAPLTLANLSECLIGAIAGALAIHLVLWVFGND